VIGTNNKQHRKVTRQPTVCPNWLSCGVRIGSPSITSKCSWNISKNQLCSNRKMHFNMKLNWLSRKNLNISYSANC